ncbi:hypothetical protein VCHC17A1_4132B, partial [Vibrio cholerae HC-17A1]
VGPILEAVVSGFLPDYHLASALFRRH